VPGNWAFVLIGSALGGQPLEVCPSRELQARLLTPLASHMKAGTPFAVKILGPVSHEGVPVLPAGSTVSGFIRRARAVGLGLRRDRASIELSFTACTLPGGRTIACEVKLLTIDNARESVRAGNRIQGILAASHPHRWLDGVWIRPAPLLVQRSAIGLTGTSGVVFNSLASSPIGAAVFLGARLALFRMPEPEVQIPAGAEMIVRVAASAAAVESTRDSSRDFPADVQSWLRELPSLVTTDDRKPAADLVNFAFFGSREHLFRAFALAGWTPAGPLNARTFARAYAAVAAMRSFPDAPVSSMLYEGRLPDLVFQKSFNSLARRHHIRLWPVPSPDGTVVWAGAATHDIAVKFNPRRLSLTHQIDPFIDRERSHILNDLSDAGCLRVASLIDRPPLARSSGGRGNAFTDGALLAVEVQECLTPPGVSARMRQPHRPFLLRALRRGILETRYYLTRANPYYWAFRAVQWTPTRRDAFRIAGE
jgi:hypothetical protein